MVNRYNISIKLQAKILQNDLWARMKKLQLSSDENLSADGASAGATRGEADLASFIFILLEPLTLTPTLIQSKAMIEASLSRLMVATQQVGENMTPRLIARKARLWFDLQKALVNSMA
jgi:hypothetical protein